MDIGPGKTEEVIAMCQLPEKKTNSSHQSFLSNAEGESGAEQALS